MARKALRAVVCASFLSALVLPAGASAATTEYAASGLAWNVLAPGQAGGLIPTANSVDQAAMYDALTPLRGNVTLSNIQSGLYFKPETFAVPSGSKCSNPPNKAKITICRDSYGVPHVTVTTRADGAFAMGYLAAADRKLLIEYGRGPGYVSALDVPGINAFGLITSATKFVPSADAKKFMNDQITAFRTASSENQGVYTDFVNYVAGVNAWYAKWGTTEEKADNITNPWTVADAVAAYSFIGSIFGAGGGNETNNAQFLAVLKSKFGETQALKVFRDMRNSNDLESPVSWRDKTFTYNAQPTNTTLDGVPGSRVIDEGSKVNSFSRVIGGAEVPNNGNMSNALLVPGSRSTTGKPLAVMGPQLGYFYPEIVMEVNIHGGGYDFRGAVAPVGPYGLIGRGKDYAWSLTSANNDNVDQFVEKLCVPGGGTPTRSTKYYEYKGVCKAMTQFDAGTIGSGNTPVTFWETVHGPVSSTVTIGGQPYAVATRRSTRGREAWSARAMADLTLNKVSSPTSFFSTANKFELTFNWHYVDYKNICMFTSGRLPLRATGVDSSLPTLGTGNYDWTGFLSQAGHAQGCNPKTSTTDKSAGLILNWNNHPAKGWGAADDEWSYGPLHRVGLFSRLFKIKNTTKLGMADVASVMNQAATQDASAVEVWPTIKAVIGSTAPNPNAQTVFNLIDSWITTNDASRLDAEANTADGTKGKGKFDFPGVAAWDTARNGIIDAVLGGRLDSDVRTALWKVSDRGGRTYTSAGPGYVSKDLRKLLGQSVLSPFSGFGAGTIYCGAGNLANCRTAIWTALTNAYGTLRDTYATTTTANWLGNAAAERIEFPPLKPNGLTMRWTNRPTFQQLISFSRHR